MTTGRKPLSAPIFIFTQLTVGTSRLSTVAAANAKRAFVRILSIKTRENGCAEKFEKKELRTL